jgi:Protein of unknown function (DUF2726)
MTLGVLRFAFCVLSFAYERRSIVTTQNAKPKTQNAKLKAFPFFLLFGTKRSISLEMVPFIEPWAIVLCFAGAGLILLLIRVVRYFLQPTVYIEPVDTLLTAAEQKFYEALDAAIDGRLLILSKVRIADLLQVTSVSRSARHRVFLSIACKHVDFVLAEAENLRPLAAIELDDSSHQRADRRLRDELLDDLFEKADFPLLRFPTAAAYSPRMIEARVEDVVQF